MKIRQRDGTMREVGDGYILRDGEAMMVPLQFMDARRPMFHDGNGHPAGQRPGFLYSDANEQAERMRDAAYAAYDADISTRWQSQRWQSQPSKPAPAPQRTFANPRDAVADAYRQYDKDISERWRK
jgi:hypothetical protein